MRWILILLSLISYSAKAEDILFNPNSQGSNFHVIELQDLALDYKNFSWLNDQARNALIYPEHPKESINVVINTNLLKYMFLNSTIESLTTGSQYRSIGLELRLGLRVHNNLEFGYYQHSEHILDGTHSYMNKFPVEDAIEIKLFLYRKEKKDSIF